MIANQHYSFQKIVVTIETEPEYEALLAALAHYSHAKPPAESLDGREAQNVARLWVTCLQEARKDG